MFEEVQRRVAGPTDYARFFWNTIVTHAIFSADSRPYIGPKSFRFAVKIKRGLQGAPVLALFVVCKTELPDEKNLKLEYCYRNSQIVKSNLISQKQSNYLINYL